MGLVTGRLPDRPLRRLGGAGHLGRRAALRRQLRLGSRLRHLVDQVARFAGGTLAGSPRGPPPAARRRALSPTFGSRPHTGRPSGPYGNSPSCQLSIGLVTACLPAGPLTQPPLMAEKTPAV